MTRNNKEILANILKDREQRFALRQAMVGRGLSSISLNLNIPGYPKSCDTIKRAFTYAVDDLLRYFVAHRIHCVPEAQEIVHAESGDFFLQGVAYVHESRQVKTFLENFEQTHALGRLLDVDLMTAKGELLSSGKQKACFLCEKPAKECMKDGRHSFSEYKKYVNKQVASYLATKKKQAVISKIAEKALQATLFEVAVEHKPGLVCPTSNGAHTDMDYFTFLASSAALTTYWQQLATFGYEKGSEEGTKTDYQEVRKQLRLMGLEAEEAMFEATKGVNTQKGIIFLIGIGCFASAFVLAKQTKFSQKAFRSCVKKVAEGLINEDFGRGYSKQETHGKEAFQVYGKDLAGGARQEAEQGFPTVFDYALAYLNSQIAESIDVFKKEDWQEVLTNLLMLIISKTNDINILYRKNAGILRQVQCQAARVLSTSSETKKSKQLKEFADYCMLHNISPGGAADLLALSLFVYFIQNLEFTVSTKN